MHDGGASVAPIKCGERALGTPTQLGGLASCKLARQMSTLKMEPPEVELENRQDGGGGGGGPEQRHSEQLRRSSSIMNDNNDFELECGRAEEPSGKTSATSGPAVGGQLCAGCRAPIRDKFLFSVIDLLWHADCVQCADCARRLSERCFTFEGKLYCAHDYWRRFGPKCYACHEPIAKSELVQRIKGSRVYHLKCFTCSQCHRRLEQGEQLHLIDNGRLLCKQDFVQQLALTNNSTDGKPPDGAKKLNSGASNTNNNDGNNNGFSQHSQDFEQSSFFTLLSAASGQTPAAATTKSPAKRSSLTALDNTLGHDDDVDSETLGAGEAGDQDDEDENENDNDDDEDDALGDEAELDELEAANELGEVEDELSRVEFENEENAAAKRLESTAARRRRRRKRKLLHGPAAGLGPTGGGLAAPKRKRNGESILNGAGQSAGSILASVQTAAVGGAAGKCPSNSSSSSSSSASSDHSSRGSTHSSAGQQSLQHAHRQHQQLHSSQHQQQQHQANHGNSNSASTGAGGHKPTRVRTVLNENQLKTLRDCYANNPRPDALMKEQLVDATGLSPRVIRVWFQNKRCKDKKKNLLYKQLQQSEKEGRDIVGLTQVRAVSMVAMSPVQYQPEDSQAMAAPADGPPTSPLGGQPQRPVQSPAQSSPALDIHAYQPPWKGLVEYASALTTKDGQQQRQTRPDPSSPRYQQLIGQIHGYGPSPTRDPEGHQVIELHPPPAQTQQQQQQQQQAQFPPPANYPLGLMQPPPPPAPQCPPTSAMPPAHHLHHAPPIGAHHHMHQFQH